MAGDPFLSSPHSTPATIEPFWPSRGGGASTLAQPSSKIAPLKTTTANHGAPWLQRNLRTEPAPFLGSRRLAADITHPANGLFSAPLPPLCTTIKGPDGQCRQTTRNTSAHQTQSQNQNRRRNQSEKPLNASVCPGVKPALHNSHLPRATSRQAKDQLNQDCETGCPWDACDLVYQSMASPSPINRLSHTPSICQLLNPRMDACIQAWPHVRLHNHHRYLSASGLRPSNHPVRVSHLLETRGRPTNGNLPRPPPRPPSSVRRPLPTHAVDVTGAALCNAALSLSAALAHPAHHAHVHKGQERLTMYNHCRPAAAHCSSGTERRCRRGLRTRQRSMFWYHRVTTFPINLGLVIKARNRLHVVVMYVSQGLSVPIRVAVVVVVHLAVLTNNTVASTAPAAEVRGPLGDSHPECYVKIFCFRDGSRHGTAPMPPSALETPWRCGAS
ncbi:uncharacterized protein J3D65DRAFT_602912 [Phyllosticta citribraziliensis]|uniref:Uncharacterized protein n=1 Tax=Phyllosticta citribraziliensis TaxID=989973 RepID=A0ABR1LNV1_9PEZI